MLINSGHKRLISILLTGILTYSSSWILVSANNTSHAAKRAAVPSIQVVQVNRKYRDFGSDVEVSYPRFSGTSLSLTKQLNSEVKKLLDDNLVYDMEGGSGHFKRPGSRFSGRYEARCVTPNVVSILFEFSHCYAGAAHGESHYVYFNYELKPQLKAMRLADILGSDADYKALSKLLFRKLFKDGREPSDLSDEEQVAFTFDEHGITWNFGSYTIGSYADGCPTASMSYPELMQVVATNYRGTFEKWQARSGRRE